MPNAASRKQNFFLSKNINIIDVHWCSKGEINTALLLEQLRSCFKNDCISI